MKDNENAPQFFDTLLQIAREASQTPTQPNAVCINQSRNIYNVKVNVWANSAEKPGFFRRLLSRIF